MKPSDIIAYYFEIPHNLRYVFKIPYVERIYDGAEEGERERESQKKKKKNNKKTRLHINTEHETQ